VSFLSKGLETPKRFIRIAWKMNQTAKAKCLNHGEGISLRSKTPLKLAISSKVSLIAKGNLVVMGAKPSDSASPGSSFVL
jgi:hypothetical protein